MKIFWLLFAAFLLAKDVSGKIRTTDAFMSAVDLKNMFKLEMAMVEVLRQQKEQLEAGLKSIRSYADQVETLYRGENCWPPDRCDDTDILERIVGNPIYNYQMLKRLLVYWKNMEEDIKKIDTKPAISELKKLKHKHGGMPTDRDLQGAAKALIRLRSTYDLDLQSFSEGNILGTATEAHLSSKDSFFLGRFAYNNGHLREAQKWLELTALQVAAETRHSNESSISSSQLDMMLSHLESAIGTDDTKQHQPKEEEYKLGVIPPKTFDRDKMVTDQDNKNFAALCRGLDLLPTRIRKHLKCFFSTQDDPYYILHPLKVEVHHPHPHLVVSFHGVLSNAEADKLVSVAQPRMVQASVGHGKEVSEMRVSRNCWIKDFESGHVDKISPRINWITRLQTTRPLDVHREGKEEEYEHLQIANYGIGGHYQSHQDPMFVYKEPGFLVYSVEHKDSPPYVTGDRLATFMLYLSDVPKGGWTAFPRLGIAVPPSKGSAVFWFNIKRSGKSDMAMLHGGCPVVLGSKWVANKWIRETANMFHIPCGENVDV